MLAAFGFLFYACYCFNNLSVVQSEQNLYSEIVEFMEGGEELLTFIIVQIAQT